MKKLIINKKKKNKKKVFSFFFYNIQFFYYVRIIIIIRYLVFADIKTFKKNLPKISVGKASDNSFKKILYN